MERARAIEASISLDEIRAAAARVAGSVRETPLEGSGWLGAAAGREVLLKLETHQRTGSFKARGAMNAVAGLGPGERARGVVTASAGNHGLGVALAAAEHGIGATVYVPADAPGVKKRRIAAMGARLAEVDGGYDAAERAARSSAAETGAIYIHAFSDPAVVAGQGTVGLEIAAARPDIGTILVPVGGGGLIGGIGSVARVLLPRARVVGVQSTNTSAMHASLEAAELRPGVLGPTICDGLAGDTDARSLRLAAAVVDGILLVDEWMVRDAIRGLHENEGLVAEGSGAVAVAALLNDLVPLSPGPVVAIVTGANIDGGLLSDILSS